MLEFQVLDRRHKGYGTFAYRVTVVGGNKNTKAVEFNALRLWCWETLGPSCERDSHTVVYPDALWAWHIETDHYFAHIYIANDETESLFRLKWM